MTIVVLPVKTDLSGGPNSTCFHRSPAPGNEAGKKGPRALTQSFGVCNLKPITFDQQSATLAFLSEISKLPMLSAPNSAHVVCPPGWFFWGRAFWSSQSPDSPSPSCVVSPQGILCSLNVTAISLAAYGSQIIPYVFI